MMTVFVNELDRWHILWSDVDEAELDQFAGQMNMFKRWRQQRPFAGKQLHFYPLRGSRLKLAKQLGAVNGSLTAWAKGESPDDQSSP